MAIYPGAVWRPLPENETQDRIKPRVVILHTAVASSPSLFGYYNSPGVVLESQFYVSQDRVEQYVDTTVRADANRNANGFAVSIEGWDNRDPAHTPWTPRQMDMLTELVAWCCVTHGIPARFCTAWDQPGIGWHTMWGAPSPWTPVAKTCPGGPRIAQMGELLARVQQAINEPAPLPVPEEDDDMLIVESTNGSRGYWLLSGPAFSYMGSVESVGSLRAAGVKGVKLHEDDFARLLESTEALKQINLRVTAIQTKLDDA